MRGAVPGLRRNELELGHHAQVVAYGDVLGEAAASEPEQMELAR
jgi:hypothetical protein